MPAAVGSWGPILVARLLAAKQALSSSGTTMALVSGTAYRPVQQEGDPASPYYTTRASAGIVAAPAGPSVGTVRQGAHDGHNEKQHTINFNEPQQEIKIVEGDEQEERRSTATTGVTVKESRVFLGPTREGQGNAGQENDTAEDKEMQERRSDEYWKAHNLERVAVPFQRLRNSPTEMLAETRKSDEKTTKVIEDEELT